MLSVRIGDELADQQEIAVVLIRTLIQERISGRLTHLGRRVSLYALAALLAGAGLSAQATAGELPSLEALLKGQKQKPQPVPTRVRQDSQFDVIDPRWKEQPVAVEPTSPEPAQLEPIPADAADLIESIRRDDRVTRALPRGPLAPPRTLEPAPPVTHDDPVIVQRQPAPPVEEPTWDTDAAPVQAPTEFVLGHIEVEKLISRARQALEAGDVLLAHTFAEAAAEREIPLELFEANAQLVIDEIELVRSLQFQQVDAQRATGEADAVETASLVAQVDELFVVADQPTPVDAEESADAEPATLAQSIEQQPRVWRALAGPALMATPPSVDVDGSRQELPEARGLRMLSQVPQLNQTMGSGRGWEPISYSWEAPALKYNPLYFEDPQLERHGNEIAYIQPAISAGRFFATIPTLPYQMGTEGNSVCHTVYDLGNDRPGTCQPYSIPLLPLSLTGALTQGGAATALVFILP